jgi:DNA-binding transcriptional LysR family regulator
MDVEVRHLRYFLAVAEELHFSRAAERVGIAQPALSQQIKRLEASVGVELFRRTKRRVALTPAGAAMVVPARTALSAVAATRTAAQRASRGEVGQLTIGFIESAAAAVIPQAVRRFRHDHPDVGLTLRELSVDAQLEGLRSRALDLGIVRTPIHDSELVLEPLIEEGLVAGVPEGHALASRRRIGPAKLATEPLVLLSRDVVPGLHDQVIALLQEHRPGATIAQEATSIQAVLGLVAAGLGITLLPASAASLTRTGVRFVAVSPSPRSSMLAARRRDDLSPLPSAFVAAARAD